MLKQEKGKVNIAIFVVAAVIVILLVCIGLFIFLNRNIAEPSNAGVTSSIRDEVITAENFDEMTDKIDRELDQNGDDIYYISYAVVYYMTQDSIAAAARNEDVEGDIYTSIYGKTVQTLIDEGKTLMEENEVSLEQYKQTIEEASKNLE